MERIPVIDKSKCTNCDKCVEVCHTNAILTSGNSACARCLHYCMSMEVPCNPGHYVFCYENCDSCGVCLDVCPVDAIYWLDSSKLNTK